MAYCVVGYERGYGNASFAGSKLITATFLHLETSKMSIVEAAKNKD